MIDETAAKLPPVIDLGSTQLIKDIEELTNIPFLGDIPHSHVKENCNRS